ncbi:unnamed protein product, partial [Hapterophycus canaliculatus]
MHPSSALQQSSSGPLTKLHAAASQGLTDQTLALLAAGSIDIDSGTSLGRTPLMCAARHGHSHVVKILLDYGANVYITNGLEGTALHVSAAFGHVAVSKMLLKAGAPLNAVGGNSCTPLHLAAGRGHAELMSVLLDLGADIDNGAFGGATPMFFGAQGGHLDVIKELLRRKADPMLGAVSNPPEKIFIPLEVAARSGHLGVVSELIKQVGIDGCGGANGGKTALWLAAEGGHLDVLAVLTDAGVIDTTDTAALSRAARFGHEACVKYFVQRHGKRDPAGVRSYVNRRGVTTGTTPVFSAVEACRPCSRRIVRFLLDAGADTASVLRVTNPAGKFLFSGTPLSWVIQSLHEKAVDGEHATEEQLQQLEGVRHLLLRVEAVHATSWRWRSDPPAAT